jgi:peptidoglycan/LPS O-acetylase OafA/YrhL
VRALAVVSVLAFHARYGWAAGGYLGGDVFFVLSGYLITGVLLSTHRSWWGYRQFLARRAVRLVPALLVATVAATAVALATHVRSPAGSCAAASLGYFMNLPFVEGWHCTAMWHITWSLSAEQQFYVVWPLLLAGLALVLRRMRPRPQGLGRGLLLAAALCVIAYAASVCWQLHLRAGGATTERVAFGPDGRSLVLLLGCGLALAVASRRARRRPRVLPRAGLLAGGSLVVLGWCLVFGHLGSEPRNAVPLVVAGLGATGLVAGLVHAPPTAWVVRALGAAPLAWLGRVSYSLYLWHEVGYQLAEQVAPRGTVTAEVLRFVLAFAFATASYYLVELPTQRAWRRRGEEPRPAPVPVPVSA